MFSNEFHWMVALYIISWPQKLIVTDRMCMELISGTFMFDLRTESYSKYSSTERIILITCQR